jgi:spermidine synthase
LKASEIDQVIQKRFGGQWLKHLTGDHLKSCFGLCKKTHYLLSLPGPILEDGVDFIMPPQVEDIDPSVTRFPVIATGK